MLSVGSVATVLPESSSATAGEAPVSRSREAAARDAVQHELARHLPSLRAHARRLTRGTAESDDLVQATALRALVFARTFEPGTNLKAWLHQILDSVFLSGCRRRSREQRALAALELDPCAWVHCELTPPAHELSPPVQSALASLPRSFAEAVRLVDVEQRSYRDAARELAVPLGTVMSRLHRGRRLLAQALAPAKTGASVARSPVNAGASFDSATPRAAAA